MPLKDQRESSGILRNIIDSCHSWSIQKVVVRRKYRSGKILDVQRINVKNDRMQYKMKTSQPITFSLASGIKIEGEIVHRSESDITVKILSPYVGLSGSLHIPYFSRPFNSFETDYGDITVEQLLARLYELGLYMDENSKFLKLPIALHFYDGEWSNKDHQKRFFDSSFPFLIPLGTMEDVLNILRSK